MKYRYALSTLLLAVAGCLFGQTFDDWVADGRQSVANGSFEDLDRDGVMPVGWGVPKERSDWVTVVTEPRESRHGARYLQFAAPSPVGLYGQLAKPPHGKYRVFLSVRGTGKLWISVWQQRPDWRSRPPAERTVNRQSSDRFDIDTRLWQEVEWDFDLQETYDDGGEQKTAELTGLVIRLTGELALDRLVVVPAAAIPAATAAAAVPAPPPSPTGGLKGLDLRPTLTIPKLPEAPTMDGTIDAAEWQQAAATTGFTILDSREWTPRQATVYVGYTDERLYVAFDCPTEGRVDPVQGARDEMKGNGVQVVEVWVVPTDSDDYFQAYAQCGGVILDVSGTQHAAWNGDWEYAETIGDIAEEIGGILSFRMKRWQVEMSVPWADVGGPPQPGATWHLNFTRDYAAAQNENRSHLDWTSWSPMRGRFRELDLFGEATFAAAAPAVQFAEFGDLANGELRATGRVTSTRPIRVSARASLAADGKTISFKTADVAAGQAVAFALADTLKVNETTEVVYELRAEDPESGVVVARQRVPFTAVAAMRVTAIPNFAQDILYVNVDARRVAGLPDTVQVEAALRTRAGTPLDRQATVVWSAEHREGDLRMPMAGLTAGDYQVRVTMRPAAGGEPLVASLASWTYPEKQPWVGNPLGITDQVLPPWQPVAVDGDTVRVTERVYTLGGLGLPVQVEALGEPLLAAPAELRTVVAGKPVQWQTAGLTLKSRTDRQVVWAVAARAAGLELTGTLTVEYDGFALWEVVLEAPKPVRVDSMALAFPMRHDRAMYARGDNATYSDRGAWRCIVNGSGPAEDIIVAGVHASANGWLWPDKWTHSLWVGDDARGLDVMCETEQYLTGAKRTEIVKGPQTNTVLLHLVDGGFELHGKLPYRYMWQGTPVKPRPSDPRIWHAGYTNQGLKKWIAETDEPSDVWVSLDMWALKHEGWPEHRRSKQAYLNINKPLLDLGIKLVPYFGTNLTTLDVPSLAPWRGQWETRPSVIGSNPCGDWAVCCPQDPHNRDLTVWRLDGILDIGFDGLYLDVSGCTGCANPYHGCGWVDAEGERHKTVPVLANRRLYERMYAVNKQDGRGGILFRHGMPVAAVAGFVDVVTQGEDWCREGEDQYDRLTPEIFRAKTMKVQYGTPFTWYVFHHYWRGIRFGGRVPLSTILCYCLPHDVLPTDVHPGMWRLWRATDPFWTDREFLPYWRADAPATAGQPGVLATVYLKRQAKQALLVVANWNREPCSVAVAVDFAALGMDPAKVAVSRALDHPILGPDDDPAGDRMENTPVKLVDGRLPLTIDGRNLELILIKQQ